MLIETLGNLNPAAPVFLTLPHSGEVIPQEAYWLDGLSEKLLLTDVDRFVDRLYSPAIANLPLPAVLTRVHRYAADLNRYPDDIDAASVEGSTNAVGTFAKGFHWSVTTQGEPVMMKPIPREIHELIVRRYHDSFHEQVSALVAQIRTQQPGRAIHHFDCHSMPSTGTGAHADAGQRRPDVVLSDFNGKSCEPRMLALTREAFEREGLHVSVNWPYQGGRITQRYGRPEKGHHTLQIELNRALYMDESTREPLAGRFEELQRSLSRVLASVINSL
jgi:N-formylglutamate deformylase